MTEFTREYFVCNGQPKPVSEFETWFGQPSRYIYEVFRVQDGVAVFIEDHLDRLWNTAALEKIDLPFTRNEILYDIDKLIQANTDGDGNIKIFITLPAHSPIIRLLYFNPHQYPTAEQFQKGISVILFNAIRENPNAKVMDVVLRFATENAKAGEEAYEVLLVDKQGNITEGSRSNVFFVRNNILITPPVHKVLEGVTRKQIILLCNKNRIPFVEQEVHQNSLKEMDAIFITGTSRRVLPVYRINDFVFEPGHPVIRKLQQMLEKGVSEYITNKQQ